MDSADVPPIILWLAIIVYGLALGSFTTCVLYRIPRRIPIWQIKGGNSHSFCPSCRHVLAWRDLVPVFSWLVQKGRCRYCGAKIGVHYLLVELVVLMAVLIIAVGCGFSIKTFGISLLIPVLAGIAAFLAAKRLS